MHAIKNKIKDLVNGNWYHVLLSLGIGESFLKNKHGPCPLCGGKDRYRWDNKDGRGTYYCQCGPGDGFQLLMKYHNWTYPETAQRIEEMLCGSEKILKKSPASKKSSPDSQAIIKNILAQAQPVKEGDQVFQYLKGRGLTGVPESLLFHPRLWESETKKNFNGMVAKICSPAGDVVSLHRTFLDNGLKAEVASPRKITTPTTTISGGAIRLYPFEERLGIAEGVESAIAAHEIFGLPVWSTMNTNGIKSFVPPGGTKEIGIFADNDSNYAGQAAAYELANKLCLKNYQVSVYIPPTDGFDWMDELLKTKGTSSYDYSEAK